MARLKGCGGDVIVGTGTTGEAGIREWNIDYTVNIFDGRGFDDDCEPHPVIGMKEWRGSFRGYKDGAPISTLFEEVEAHFKESDTTGQEWTGSIIITAVHPRTVVDGLVEYSYDFEGKGTLTIATA